MFLCEQVLVCTSVCAKVGGVVEPIEVKYQRRGEGLDPREKTSPSVSIMTTPHPLCTHIHTQMHTHLTRIFSQTEPPLPPSSKPPSSEDTTEQRTHWTGIRGNLVLIFFIATLAIMTLYFVIYCSHHCFSPVTFTTSEKH